MACVEKQNYVNVHASTEHGRLKLLVHNALYTHDSEIHTIHTRLKLLETTCTQCLGIMYVFLKEMLWAQLCGFPEKTSILAIVNCTSMFTFPLGKMIYHWTLVCTQEANGWLLPLNASNGGLQRLPISCPTMLESWCAHHSEILKVFAYSSLSQMRMNEDLIKNVLKKKWPLSVPLRSRRMWPFKNCATKLHFLSCI